MKQMKDNVFLDKIRLPNDFMAEKVEVIVLPIEDQSAKIKSISSLRGKLKLTNEQYKDFHQYVNDSRSEWETIV